MRYVGGRFDLDQLPLLKNKPSLSGDGQLGASERIEMPSPQISYKRHSREGACEKIEIADFGETPQRYSREGGNPFQPLEQGLRGDDAAVRLGNFFTGSKAPARAKFALSHRNNTMY